MYDSWEIERDHFEWARIESIKQLWILVRRDLIDIVYPREAEQVARGVI